ncbi:hypothetical protein [Dapis sp. BLCC M229]|uniref:hypothetical protein n=1 Tax=Dapis sp. BLCC M229 TaxID=3400188 RepID=UPI003CE797F8
MKPNKTLLLLVVRFVVGFRSSTQPTVIAPFYMCQSSNTIRTYAVPLYMAYSLVNIPDVYTIISAVA